MAEQRRFANADPDERSIPKEERDKISAALERIFPEPPKCSLCGHQKWSINERFVSPVIVHYDQESTGWGADFSVMHPCIFLHCMHCGNSQMLSASILDIDGNLREPPNADEAPAK